MGGFGNAQTGFVTTGRFADPATWRINIRRSIDPDINLKRSRGIPAAGDLPTIATVLRALGVGVPAGGRWPRVFDAPPFNGDPPPPGPDFVNQVLSSFRKFLEFLLHDGIHNWIGDTFTTPTGQVLGGHMSFPAVSVNDPVFFLHHANVDRLWAIWQRKSPTPAYVPTSGANAGHNAPDVMSQFANPAHFTLPLLQHPADLQHHQAVGPWYHSDPPEVTLATPSVSFGDVPDQLTTFAPVQLHVRTCQPVTVTITGVTGANFSVPPGQGPVTIDHQPGSSQQTASVHVAFHAVGALGMPQAGSVTIEASYVDRDGYDAPAPGSTVVLGPFTVNLSATPVARPTAAVAMVLDRSGSMAEAAGVAGTKYDLLRSSMQVVADVARTGDGVGLVTFDDVVMTLSGVEEMGPLGTPPPTGSGRAAVAAMLAGADLVPRGLTGIGQAMIAGAGVLDAERLGGATPFAVFAMLVMTDGNQNVAPDVEDPAVVAAVAPYSSGLYAVGLGEPGNVSDTTLGAIANAMLVTGDMTAAARRFRLTKYFIQILSGVTRNAIVVDPQGELHLGTEHRIPFQVTESDIELDVIALCPLAPLLEFTLEAPDGTRIDPAFAAPTLIHQVNREDAFYRFSLPVDPAVRGEGRWFAVLRLTEQSLKDHARDLERWSGVLAQFRTLGALPYSLVVRSYSNLDLSVYVKPTAILAGDHVELFATLKEYGQPLSGISDVVVEVTDPAGAMTTVTLAPSGPGAFAGAFTPALPGLHLGRFLATGFTRGGVAFQREETRSVSAFSGVIPDGTGDGGDDRRGRQPPPDRLGDAGRESSTSDEVSMMEDHPEREAPGPAPADEVADHPFLRVPPPPPRPAAPSAPEHAAAGHDHLAHEDMHFEMFRLDPSGDVVKVDIRRDTSGYDEEGNDPGVKRPAPRPGHEDEPHGGHGGHHH
jgi:Mg-chelatase subunit ChlD